MMNRAYKAVGFQLANKGLVQKVEEKLPSTKESVSKRISKVTVVEDAPVMDEKLQTELKKMGLANDHNKKQVRYREKS